MIDDQEIAQALSWVSSRKDKKLVRKDGSSIVISLMNHLICISCTKENSKR